MDLMFDHVFVRVMGAGAMVLGVISLLGGLLVLVTNAFGAQDGALWIAGAALVVVGVALLLLARVAYQKYMRSLDRRRPQPVADTGAGSSASSATAVAPESAPVVDPGLVAGCFACDQQAAATRPPREDVLHTDHWHVVHAFNSTLPGWLVVLPTRHVTAYTQLAPAAAAELGGLLHRLSSALEQVTGCAKTYLMQFSEQEGFTHLHVHLVPRMPDQPDDRRGPRVFGYVVDDETQWIPEGERDRIAREIRSALGDVPK